MISHIFYHDEEVSKGVNVCARVMDAALAAGWVMTHVYCGDFDLFQATKDNMTMRALYSDVGLLVSLVLQTGT
jgi:hypothetical protein